MEKTKEKMCFASQYFRMHALHWHWFALNSPICRSSSSSENTFFASILAKLNDYVNEVNFCLLAERNSHFNANVIEQWFTAANQKFTKYYAIEYDECEFHVLIFLLSVRIAACRRKIYLWLLHSCEREKKMHKISFSFRKSDFYAAENLIDINHGFTDFHFVVFFSDFIAEEDKKFSNEFVSIFFLVFRFLALPLNLTIAFLSIRICFDHEISSAEKESTAKLKFSLKKWRARKEKFNEANTVIFWRLTTTLYRSFKNIVRIRFYCYCFWF